MNCIKPWNGFPCGKCINCRIQYSASWASRLLHELAAYNNVGCFVTLTFNDDFIGENNLNVKDLQLFLKRLRKKIMPKKIKYFACGEYGDNTHRAHYHCIIFGLAPNSLTTDIIRDCWPFGFVKIGTCTYDSCRYVTDYVLKKYSGDKYTKEYGDKTQPFRIMSNGLGKAFFLSNFESMIKNDGFYIRGKFRKLPRYYRELYLKDYEIKHGTEQADFERWRLQRERRVKSFVLGYDLYDRFMSLPISRNIDLKDYLIKCARTRAAHKSYMSKNYSKGGL